MPPQVFEQVFIGLVVAELSMLGILAAKGFAPSVAIVPLLVLTALFRHFAGQRFARPMRTLSLHAAADLDRADKSAHWTKDLSPDEEAEMLEKFDCEDVRFGPMETRYLSDAFKVSAEEHSAVLVEAEHLVMRVDSGDTSVQHEPEETDDLDSPRAAPVLPK